MPNEMREILFRAKRKDNKEWIQGSYIKSVVAANPIGYITPSYPTEPTQVYTFTLGQYTGLTDSHGKIIFEGDILQFDYIGEGKGVNGKATVCFENGKFGVRWGWHKEFVCLDGFANTTIEVIGNIHDNPELLKGE